MTRIIQHEGIWYKIGDLIQLKEKRSFLFWYLPFFKTVFLLALPVLIGVVSFNLVSDCLGNFPISVFKREVVLSNIDIFLPFNY